MNPLFVAGAQATKHAILRTFSILCVLAVIAGLWWAVNKTFINPRETSKTVQTADLIQNIENLPKQDIRHFLKTKWLWGALDIEIF